MNNINKRSIFFSFFLFCLFLIISSAAYAEWISKGPAGTNIESIYCSQGGGGVFAGTNGGVYNTNDSGEIWNYKGLRFRPVVGVGTREACNLDLFASGWNDLFNSGDGGDTWNLFSTFSDDITTITMSYPPDCTGYIGTAYGVFATNGNSGLPGMSITALAVDSSNNVYAATEEDGVYKSANSGSTWLPVNTDLTNLYVRALKIDAGDMIFAGTAGGGVFSSTNGGAGWTPKNTGLPIVEGYPGTYAAMSLEKDGNGNLYSGLITALYPLSGAVYKSTDNGDTWNPTNSSINNYFAKYLCSAPDNKLFVGTSHGIFRSDDFGSNWFDLSDKISALPFNNSFVTDDIGTIYVGSDGGGIYESNDAGASWIQAGEGTPKNVRDLLMDGLGAIYCSSGDMYGVFKSVDNGDTWTLASTGLPTHPLSGMTFFEEGNALAIDGNGRIYVGLVGGAVYATDNEGDNWSATSGLPFASVSREIKALRGDTGSTVYAGTKGEGVFKSTDGGTVWTKKNNGLPPDPEVQQHALFIDKDSGDIYLGLENSGLYKSSNGGDDWMNIQPVPGCEVNSVTMDRNGNLYAVVCSDSVYVSRDRGASWTDLDSGLVPGDSVNGIQVKGIFADSMDHLLLSTQSSGMYRFAVFSDVPGTHWAYDYIEAFYDNGMTTGCSFDGLFRAYCPASNVTRAAMAAFIIRSLYGEDFDYTLTPYFTDVQTSHPFFKYIQKMKDEGLTTGCTGTEYCPTNNVTRAAMAAFVIRALYGDTFTFTTTPYFTDVPDTNQFFKYIQKMNDDGITTGYEDGTYRPQLSVTRAAMAAFMTRAFLGMP